MNTLLWSCQFLLHWKKLMMWFLELLMLMEFLLWLGEMESMLITGLHWIKTVSNILDFEQRKKTCSWQKWWTASQKAVGFWFNRWEYSREVYRPCNKDRVFWLYQRFFGQVYLYSSILMVSMGIEAFFINAFETTVFRSASQSLKYLKKNQW